VDGCGRFFDTGSEFWMNLQSTFELASADPAVVKAIRPRKVV